MMNRPPLTEPHRPVDLAVAAAVRSGLMATPKSLPAWLLYDDDGSHLYDQITRLPEYYLTRAEAEILSLQADAIVERLSHGRKRVALIELGAATAIKTESLLHAVVRAQGACDYYACDISPAPLNAAKSRIERRMPTVQVRPIVGPHAHAANALAGIGQRQVLLFIGSSIGNYPDEAAIALLTKMRAHLRDDAMLVLGADLRKEPSVLLPAYDDAQGVTAAFSLNLLRRLNRELHASFDLDAFRHVATWDPRASNIEIYLESVRDQRVCLGRLGCEVHFRAGERIHTETSAKYDQARIDKILTKSGFTRIATHQDTAQLFAVHIAKVSAS